MKKTIGIVLITLFVITCSGFSEAKTNKKAIKKPVNKAAQSKQPAKSTTQQSKEFPVLTITMPQVIGASGEVIPVKLSGFEGKWEGDPIVEIDEKIAFGTTKKVPIRKGMIWRIGGYADVPTPSGSVATIRISGPYSSTVSPVINSDKKVDLIIEKLGEDSGTF